MLLAIGSRPEVLSCWKRAFPAGGVRASIDADKPLPAGVEQVWLHAGGQDPVALGATVSRLVAACGPVPVVVMSDAPEVAAALQALNAGARGYCHAMASGELLVQVSVVVANRGLWVGPELMKRMLGSVASALGVPDTPELSLLTPRERSVAIEVSAGATNKEAARALGITERTVKAHLASVFDKLAVRDRLELAIRLRERPAGLSRSVA